VGMLSDRLRKFRKEKRMSLTYLAGIANVSKGYLWQLENYENKHPSAHILCRIAAALDVTITDLIGNAAKATGRSPDYRTAHEWPIDDDVDIQPIDNHTCLLRVGDKHMRITWKAAALITQAIVLEMELHMRRHIPDVEVT